MKFIPYEVRTGAENMQIDSDLLDFAIKEQLQEPIFRLYGWSPACVSLGRNQRDLQVENVDIVRRLTGGRALLHDNEITYSYVCPQDGSSVTESYKKISQILIDAFAQLGINLSFGGQSLMNNKPFNHSTIQPFNKKNYCMSISTGADLCYQGKKLIGSAQFRKDGYILQHGSILYDYDRELLEKIFGEPVDNTAITCIREINPELSKQDIIDMLQSLNNLKAP